MPLLGWIVRVLIVAFVLRLVLRMFRRPEAPAGRRTAGKPIERAGGTLVRDPQCGTYIPMSRAIAVGRGEDAKHFCSVECRDRYVERSKVPRAEGPKGRGSEGPKGPGAEGANVPRAEGPTVHGVR